jgi:hypothetical protein
MTSTEDPWRRACRRICRDSASKCVGEPVSFDAHDSYGSGGGSARGYAMTGGRCAPCMGATLLVSHKHRIVLS